MITHIDHKALVQLAAACDCVLKLRPALGEFVPAGASVFEIQGQTERVDRDAAIRALTFGPERTLDQDMAYGLRMLVDIDLLQAGTNRAIPAARDRVHSSRADASGRG